MHISKQLTLLKLILGHGWIVYRLSETKRKVRTFWLSVPFQRGIYMLVYDDVALPNHRWLWSTLKIQHKFISISLVIKSSPYMKLLLHLLPIYWKTSTFAFNWSNGLWFNTEPREWCITERIKHSQYLADF